MIGGWTLQDFAPGEGAQRQAQSAAFDDRDWLPVDVPGDVHRALLAAARIPHPFYDRNETECGWVQRREWWYRTTVEGPSAPAFDERIRLIFHGLDTLATVWLNGEEVGRHRNMFRPLVLDVGELLRPGVPNTLAVRFDPLPGVGAPVVASRLEQWGRDPERAFIRKAQFGFGWDWAPRLPGIGIWRPVELRRERAAVLAGVRFRTLELDPDGRYALVAVTLDIDAFAATQPVDVSIRLFSTAGDVAAEAGLALPAGDVGGRRTVHLRLENPRLWWTHDLGEPVLYRLNVSLEDAAGLLDSWSADVGIRTLGLDQAPDPEEPGTRFFRFVLNGVPVFARGANWIPADSFVGGIEPERYTALLRAARDANMTMLRVWGGGIYEHDDFYAACDQLGIMVWQDFMFACATYPEYDPDFVAEVEAEARYQVARLRSHPCLALWCGNNENQWIHDQKHWDDPGDPVPGVLFYERILPRVVAELDGVTAYWPGSPFGGNDHNGEQDGDAHNWRVWHGLQPRRFGEPQEVDSSPRGVSYLHYAGDHSRFVSEFGMHASPVPETIRRCIPEDQRQHHSAALDHHNKDHPKDKGDNLMLTVTGLPRDLREYVDFSMVTQAEGLKFGIEHFRRRKPHCSGTLFWQLNDCWPGSSWSVIDYYGFGKAGYYYARRAYAPVLASFKPLEDGGLELWVTNDSLREVADTAEVCFGAFADEVWHPVAIPLVVPPGVSMPVAAWRAATVPADAAHCATVTAAGGSFAPNRHFFVALKDLDRQPVAPEMGVRQLSEDTLQVQLRAPTFARFVHFETTVETTRFSDNYFDLLPGRQHVITVTNPGGAPAPERLTIRWA